MTPPAGDRGRLRVVLTRPAGRQTELSHRLTQMGCEVIELPALDISPIAPQEQTSLSAPDWQPQAFDAVVWVSRGAWQHYLKHYLQSDAQHDPQSSLTGLDPLLACVGIATARQIASDLDIPLERITFPSAELSSDSEGLWAVLKPRLKSAARVLIVRGETGRDWLSDTLLAHGMRVTCLSVYRRTPKVWTSEQVNALCAGVKNPGQLQELGRSDGMSKSNSDSDSTSDSNGGIWLITSAQGLSAIAAQFDAHGLTGKPGLKPKAVVVVHERLVQPVRQWLAQWDEPQASDPTPVSIKVAIPDDDAIVQALLAVNG